jgi:acetyl-CoA carboxylase biotin carboxyl carrier protein
MSSVPFNAEAVRALAAILKESGLTEIEVEGKDLRIRVARSPTPVMASVAAPAAAAAAAAAALPAPTAEAALLADEASHPGAVLSPMVGIAYLSPEPGAAAFVMAGQAVTVGQTLLLIEAMKTFNQIKATKAGTVARILITPGEPVEYGQPLLILE